MATIVFGDFEWEGQKAVSNQRKHGVSFDEASTVFADTNYILKADSATPDRFHVIGMSASRAIVVASFAGATTGRDIPRRARRRAYRGFESLLLRSRWPMPGGDEP